MLKSNFCGISNTIDSNNLVLTFIIKVVKIYLKLVLPGFPESPLGPWTLSPLSPFSPLTLRKYFFEI